MQTKVIIDAYLNEARQRQLSPKTIDGCYGWALSKLEAAFPDRLPEDPADVLAFIACQELAPTSRQNLWRALRTFWKWAVRNHLADSVVMESVPVPRTRTALPRTLTDEELARLLEAPRSRRDTALLAVPLDTGIRVGELASLRRSRIRPRSLVVSGKVGDRAVPISPHVHELLSELGEGESVWVGRRGPMTAPGISLTIRRLLYQAGIMPPKAGPHTLRHTFALRYIMRGGDVFSLQRILGHRSVETTMIYVNMSADHLVAQHSRYSPMAEHHF